MDQFKSIYEKWAKETIEEIRKTLSSYPPNRGKGSGLRDADFLKNIDYKVSAGNVYLEYPEYGKWIERGRGENKTPPPAKALLPWLNKKGIDENLVWAIAKNIGKFGITPRPFMSTIDSQLDVLEQMVADELEKQLLEK